MAQQESLRAITLMELAYLRRLQKYQKRKSDHIQYRLNRLESSCEARNRIIQSGRILHEQLTDSVQSENGNKFAVLYNTFDTLRQACDEWDSQSSETSTNLLSDNCNETFLESLSPDARDSLLLFLSRIALDPEFLLDRFLRLTDHEFAMLFRAQSRVTLPVFGSHAQTTQESSHESLGEYLDFSRSNTLALLFRLIPGGEESQGREHYNSWGIICAGLLSQQKPGSDKFVVAVMNAHAESLDKAAHQCMENWLLETLRDGEFLVSQARKYPSRTKLQTPQGHSNDDDKAIESFFSKAIGKLLLMITRNQLTQIIPHGILRLGRSIVANLAHSSRQQQAAPYFICTRWLFASFMFALITKPESHGLLLSHHIAPIVRQRVLYELAHRARHMMESVAYAREHTSSIRSSVVLDVEKVVDLFRLHLSEPGRPPVHGLTSEHLQLSGRSVTVCASEMISAVHTLYPGLNHDTFQALTGIDGSTLRSSASSVSGMSLFRTTSPSDFNLPRTNHPESVPRMTRSQGSHPSGPVSTSPGLDSVFGVTKDRAFDYGLAEACNELMASTGLNPRTGHCDPLSEKWTNVTLRLDSNAFQRVSNPRCDMSNNSIIAGSGSAVPHDRIPRQETFEFISVGISNLIDEFVPLIGPHHATTFQDASVLHASLINQFESARATCYHQGDFAKAHLFFRLAKKATESSSDLTLQVMKDMARDLQQSVESSRNTIYDAGIRMERLNERIDLQQIEIEKISYKNDRLREKMWYATDVQRAGRYEDLRRVVSALRVLKSSSHAKTGKKQPLLRHRSASKSLNHDLQLKAEAATLELVSAPVGRGAPGKLGDLQVELTLQWMHSRGVERICKSEERIHRFCSEVTSCLDYFVGHSIAENPILWSSELFRNQKPLPGQINGRNSTPNTGSTALDQLRSLYNNRVPNIQEHHATTQWGRPSTPFGSEYRLGPGNAGLNQSIHGSFGYGSPALTHKSSGTLWSTFSADPQSPSSGTSFQSRALSPSSAARPLSRRSCLQRNQGSFLEELKQNLTSLLLSDFQGLFRSGSETDKAIRTTLKLGISVDSKIPDAMDHELIASKHTFDFDHVFRMLLRHFELQLNPYTKLDILLELQTMLQARLAESDMEAGIGLLASSQGLFNPHRVGPGFDAINTPPRTCAGQDSAILCFRELFQNTQLRPKTLFRDLQYIASLVPLSILDNTPRGRAFWNATIASLDIKEEICQSMVEIADRIIHHHTTNRGHSHVTSAAQAERDATAFSPSTPQPSDPSITNLNMSDAATLLQLTAKEGLPVAQRELATLYLTHPELLSVCLSPFSRSNDVFGHVERDPEGLSERYDPVAMAVARHWMELSAKGRDGPAARYLRGKDEFDI